MNGDLQLLLDWEPRWQSFRANVGAILQRAPGPLQAEHSAPRYGSFSASLLLHVAIVTLTFSIYTTGLLKNAQHVLPPDFSHVVYYPASDLPAINDKGGASEGKQGKSGGQEHYHPRQTIRIARAMKVMDRVVDAPRLKLPITKDPVANLLALGGPLAPTTPVDAARRSLANALLNQAAVPVAPAPDDPTRSLSTTPKLAVPADIVQPAPANIRRSLAQARLGTDPDIVRPAPENVAREIAQARLAALPFGVVQPAPDNLARNMTEAKLSVPVGVVQPAPENTARALSQFGGLPGPAKPGIAPPQGDPHGRGGSANGGAAAGDSQAKAHGQAGGAGAQSSASAASSDPGAGGPGGPMGIIVSLHPGDKVGMPLEQILGALAMSPGGGTGNGFGGSGGGSGIGHGTGTGLGTSGTGPGAGSKGAGLGADPAAHGGSSPAPGPGGTGSGNVGTPMAGITVRGNTVALPSFAGPAGLDPHSSLPLGPRRAPPLIVVASPRAGGALNRYGVLKGNKIYTIYMETELGTAILQYTDHSSAPGEFHEDLTAPELEHTEYPSGIGKKLRLVVSCLIEPTGSLKELHILESSNPQLAAKMMAALSKWRFRPVLRGDKAVEAQAIVGFGVDTR